MCRCASPATCWRARRGFILKKIPSVEDAGEPGAQAGQQAGARARRLVGEGIELAMPAGNLVSTEIHGLNLPVLPAMVRQAP